MNELIFCTAAYGPSQSRPRTQDPTVWLTPLEMADLFDATKQNISLHPKTIFEGKELGEGSVVKESLTAQARFNGPATTQKCPIVPKAPI